jgi:hypothetical protein
MTIKRPEEDQPQPIAEEPTRKLYSKPGFQFESVFETMALACGKTSHQGNTCKLVLKNS